MTLYHCPAATCRPRQARLPRRAAGALVALSTLLFPALATGVGPSYASTAVAAPYGAIGGLWRSLGGPGSVLGQPTDAEHDAAGGWVEDFAGGAIYWSPGTGAHEVHGAIRAEYEALGGPGSVLGYPITDETRTPDGAGRFNHFTGGSVYWSPATGAHEVHGAIRQHWAELGWEAGVLGYPTTDETGAGPGRFNRFTGGTMSWSPGTGAHEVHGAILGRYLATGGEAGVLGYPVTDETGTPDGVGRYNHFAASGSIYWTPGTGAHVVRGPLRSRWASEGWEAGPSGYPVGEEYAIAGGGQQDFQRGLLNWWSSPQPAPNPAPTPAGNPLAGARFYADPNSNAARQAAAERQSNPADAAQFDKIATQGMGDWYGDWVPTSSLASTVRQRVSQESAAGALPLLVLYDIPHRDCGGYSSGGAPDDGSYQAFVAALAQADRLSLIAGAVRTLAADPGTAVYLDAGNPTWQTADVMAPRLRSAGIAGARGFALNVSNFQSTAASLSYGHNLSGQFGGKPFVVDTSRNGAGPAPDNAWCNPPGRALGDRPTGNTGDALADGYLWIKRGGESDGTCNGGPPAGQWDPSYALGLAQRAAY
jgi:Glycosyl hydrolases family 6/LGFP repeat